MPKITTAVAAAAMVFVLAGCAGTDGPHRINHDGGEIRIGQGIGLYPEKGAAIVTTSAGVRIANLPTMREADAGVPAHTIYIDARGFLYRVVP